jgi:hypothetical protein
MTSRPRNILEQSLIGFLRRPHTLTKPQHRDVKELFEISRLWVRNVGNRHDIKLQTRRLIGRIVRRLRSGPVRRRMPKT